MKNLFILFELHFHSLSKYEIHNKLYFHLMYMPPKVKCFMFCILIANLPISLKAYFCQTFAEINIK